MGRLDGFRDFCGRLLIPSKEGGLKPLAPLWGTQEYFIQQMEAGLERGVHEFVPLKGRQQGITTICDALDLYWPQVHDGIVGMIVLDDDGNIQFRRDVIRQMLDSLPRTHRQSIRVDNQGMLAFAANKKTGFTGSRVMFAAAGKRTGGNLGRSRGVNYVHGDELAYWVDQKAYSGFRNSLAKTFDGRLYNWPSTANGIGGIFHELYRTSEGLPNRMAMFIGWWRHAGFDLTPDNFRETFDQLWDRFGVDPPVRDEIAWIVEIKRRYDYDIRPSQLAWYRYILVADCHGDEAFRAQEYPCVADEAFQAFGDKFIDGHVVQAMRRKAEGREPVGYEYDWAKFLEHTEVRPCDVSDAQLVVWEEPQPEGVYVIAAHAWGSSSPRAKENVVHVYRAWPDRLRLVAEFAGGTEVKTYQLAWVCLHLCGAYHTRAPIWRPPYFIFDVSMGGQHLLSEIKLIEELGFGTSPVALTERSRIVNMMGAIHYLYRRLDSFTSSVVRDIKIGGSVETRARVLYALRDHAERDHLEIWSAQTIDQLAMLRQGEDDDADSIAGGGETEESRALTLCMAIEAWRSQAIGDLTVLVAPREPQEQDQRRAEHVLVAGFLQGLRETGGTDER